MSKLKTFDTIKALAENTGLSTFMLRQLVREGKLPYIMSGKKYLINTAKALEILKTEYQNSESCDNSVYGISESGSAVSNSTQGSLIDMIVNQPIEPPGKLTARELDLWTNGYMKCQQDVIALIKNAIKQNIQEVRENNG